jgi:hypothetical protein
MAVGIVRVQTGGVKATRTIGSPTRRPRRRFTAEQIQKYLRAFDRSGDCAAGFARQHDLVHSVLLRWLQRRRQAPGAWPRAKSGSRRQVKLQELPLGSLLGTGRWAAEIVRPDGVTVRVAHDVPVGWWEGLLDRGAC